MARPTADAPLPAATSLSDILNRLYTAALVGGFDGSEWDDVPPHDGYGSNKPPQYSPPSLSSTGRGILIGLLSALGSALFIGAIIALVYFFRHTNRGRIFLDRIGRPGEFDDEQAFAREEAEALEEMDDIQRADYMRAKAFVQANPPESVHTDISLSQFLAIQEKGVSAWEFEPELEIANCFVEARTEIEFFDSACSVQSNLPVPKQNEVYYWEAKIYDKPESTHVSIGMTTKPYPLFRLPGYHKTSVAYTSHGARRFNQPFNPQAGYGPPYARGDVIGCGYRPRTGTVFFTRNGKKLDDVTHTLKSQNLFPTVGADGPCVVHVNLGQSGFVFIEANVKKWGLAPMTGSLAPPPPYGSEQGSILLEGGQHGVQEGQGWLSPAYHSGVGNNGGWGDRIMAHARTRSAQARLGRQSSSPGPQRSPTDISLTRLSLIDAVETDEETDREEVDDQHEDGPSDDDDEDAGEGASAARMETTAAMAPSADRQPPALPDPADAPPEYRSPSEERGPILNQDSPRPQTAIRTGGTDEERQRLLDEPPIPSYDAAVSGRR